MSIRGKYEPITTAAQGTGGNNNRGVIVVRHKKYKTVWIEKRVRPGAIIYGSAQREIRMMQQAGNHPNIVSLYDWTLEHERVGYGSLYLQRGELGPLDALIIRYRNKGKKLEDEGFAWKVLWDLTAAVVWLNTGCNVATMQRYAAAGRVIHKAPGWKPIYHRDIKPSNMFMTWEGQGDVRWPNMLLGDFGCALTDDDRPEANAMPLGDKDFAAPEEPAYSQYTDVYSSALVIACLGWMVHAPPKGIHALSNNWASAAMHGILDRMLNHYMRDRPTPGELPKYVYRAHQEWLATQRDYPGARLRTWGLFSQ
ncbi:hypothetical protein HBI56_205100 [Parastagonospora nodorum]|nr:hypothetical protein HBI10_124430 [Parastagonospora nodorum]KAH4024269.1 hypothetical protein HBI13_085100 [Parastagonospora nodorum]KAH4294151.1 hypothetical protein HBI01_166110 [Parastagonospora nodorum]KAH4297243.1 hypothetical protein HBI02_163490 [Parastagonospora nodorum]KAH4325708.1 hypothetical protein HBI00_152800 [Parastagonospora nodorum]